MIVVFEGSDGAGKTTLINIIYNRLKKLGYNCRKLKCPDYQFNYLREYVVNKNDDNALFQFYKLASTFTSFQLSFKKRKK